MNPEPEPTKPSRQYLSASSFRLSWCARAMRRGGVVAYPTEAVWGLGCDPWSRTAVHGLLAFKGRVAEQGLIVIGADSNSLLPFFGEPTAEIASLLSRAHASSTGPTTWVVPAAAAVPAWITGVYSSVAVRITEHPPAAALCRAYGGAIVSTSANPSARRPATSASAVRRYFNNRIDGLLPGAVGPMRRPTPIQDLLTGEWLRA